MADKSSTGLRHYRSLCLGLVDATAWISAIAMAAATRVLIADLDPDWTGMLLLGALAAAIHVATGLRFRGLLGAFKIGSVDEALSVVKSWGITAVIVFVADLFLTQRAVPLLGLILAFPLALSIMLGARLAWRVTVQRPSTRRHPSDAKRVLIFGAGEGGDQIVRSMLLDENSKYMPVALLDDDPSKRHRELMGVRVRGTKADIAQVAGETRADVLLIAIPSANNELISELERAGREARLEVKVLPSTTELMGMISTADIRELTETDLLGRAEVEVDVPSIERYLTGKRVLVTGAGGSIGSELCRQLARFNCESLIMLDRDETGLHSTQLSIEGRALLDSRALVVADIRDRDRVFEVFEEHRPHVVFHTAALKHLTLLEMYPEEGRKTNVEGSRNLLDAAEAVEVEHYVNVSTDKAADPTSVLGRTKLEAEKLTAQAAMRATGTFVSVRFGNVLGSRGSVLPIFRHQISRGGPVTVTDPMVTRYFMSIPEAVRLVLQAGAIGRPAEVMILDMGDAVKIVDLAQQLIDHSGAEIDIIFTGLRPGEKLDEDLVSRDEDVEIREHPRIMHALPHSRQGGLGGGAQNPGTIQL